MNDNSKTSRGLDAGQFETLFRSEYNRLYYFAIGIIPDSNVVNDLLQDLFAAVWANRHKMNALEMRPYLTTATRNRCLNWLRHSAIEGESVEAEAMADTLPDSDGGELMQERLDRLDAALAQMPEKTRFVLEECYYHNKRYKDVAQELSITSDAIKKHMTKAFSILRKYFEVKK